MEEYKWLIMLLTGVLLLAAVAYIKYIFIYSNQIRRVKMEIRRAYTPQDRNQWRRELLMLQLSTLPGISPKWAKRMSRKAYKNSI